MASAALLVAKSIIDRVVGEPPPSGAELLVWKSRHELLLAWADELLLFTAVLLIPVVQALYRSLQGSRRPWVAFGCGILAATIPLSLVLGMVHGRLMYPVFGIEPADPASMALVTSLYYGGAHEVALLLAAALIMLSLAMARSAYGRWAAALGLVAGVSQIAASFPWLIGPDLLFISQTLLAGWLVLIGSRLIRRRGFTEGEPAEGHTPIDRQLTQLGWRDGNPVSRQPEGQT